MKLFYSSSYALFSLAVFCLFPLAQGAERLRFKRLTIKDGLSQGTVTSILQDNTGFMWFGTEDGLNRYDGYDFKVFRADAQDPTSLPAQDVTCLLEDQDGFLWVGSFDGGLSQFHKDTELFENFASNPEDPSTLSSNLVTCMIQDLEGMIWIGSQDGGLSRFNPKTKKATRFMHDPENADTLSANMVSCLYLDGDQLWIGGSSGLNCLDLKTGRIKRFPPNPKEPLSLRGGDIRGVAKNKQGILWISMRSQGLAHFDPETGYFHHYAGPEGRRLQNAGKLFVDHSGNLWVGTWGQGLARIKQEGSIFSKDSLMTEFFTHNPSDQGSLSGGDIQSIYEDRTGILWIGALGNGVNRQDPWAGRFEHYHSASEVSLGNNMVWAITCDEDDNVWVGTDKGLTRINPDRTQSHHYLFQETESNGIGGETILALFAGRNNQIWIGYWNAGLDLLVREGDQDRFVHYRHNPGDASSIGNDFVYSLLEDHAGVLWVGGAGGVSIKQPSEEGFTHFRHRPGMPGSLSHDEVVSLYEDPFQRIWVGTSGGGVNLYSRESNRFRQFLKDQEPHGLDSNAVSAILCKQKNVVWLGTNGGLNKLELKGEDQVFTTHYRNYSGHPHSSVYQIQQDPLGRLWISSNEGLSRFDPDREVFRNYDAYDGLQSREFNAGSSFLGPHGELFFGGVNGLNTFFPEKIVDDVSIPNIVLTEFLLANQPVQLKHRNPSSPLEKTIEKTSAITLNYKQNVFSFHFAALHFAVPENQQYAYKMVGFDGDWVQTSGKQRIAAYTNLNPGEYTFLVKGSNHDGAWNPKPTSVKINILPPPWLSWWAKLLYVFAVSGIVFIYIRYQKKKLDFARALNERQNQVNEQLKEMDRQKDSFLANTSHELKTPLNGIIGLAETMLDGSAGPVDERMKRELAMIVSGGKRLSSLVNDILDFSRLKNRRLILHLRPLDLHRLVDVVLTLSRPLVRGKQIILKNATPTDMLPVHADENRLQQILHNLIGNSIKFTESGLIEVSAEMGDAVTVHVKDTGMGIPSDQLETIFESFEQVEHFLIRAHGGTGLGLAITRQLVNLHHGKIWVSSKLNEGSVFSFTLPYSSEPATIITEERRGQLYDLESRDSETVPNTSTQTEARILVVDDEPVNRRVLHNMLSKDGYEVAEVADGNLALQLLEENAHFDLILLDVMMPRLSGYDTCKKLRLKYPLEELPVIFLTARDRVSDLMEGFKAGGNDFLTKPVSKGELLTRVRNHLTLLHIHRNLDTRVKERTLALDLRNKELAERNKEILHTQNQLIMNEKMATLGTLTAGVAHEINNPNNFVSGGIQRLRVEHQQFKEFLFHITNEDKEACELFDERFNRLSEMVETIQDGSKRIGDIVKNLSLFTLLNESEHKEIDVLEGLQATVLLLKPSYQKVDFVLNLGPPLLLKCWPAQINQVFMNLLLNACEAFEDSRGRVEVFCKREEHEVSIYFKDNGPGIPPEDRDKIFEAFFTTKKVGSGTGLGLYTSFRIIEKHKGRISLESSNGMGSLFGLHLPCGQP